MRLPPTSHRKVPRLSSDFLLAWERVSPLGYKMFIPEPGGVRRGLLGVSILLVKQRKGEFTRHTESRQMFLTEGRACLKVLTAALLRTYPFLSHLTEACALTPLECHSLPSLSVYVFCSLILCPTNKKPLPFASDRTDCPLSELSEIMAWGC